MKKFILILLSIALIGVVACGPEKKDNKGCAGLTDAQCKTKEKEDTQLKAKLESNQTYAKIAYASYSDALAKAEALKKAIDAFVTNPSQDLHEKAKKAWIDSRPAYLQTEAYRFYDGPINKYQRGKVNGTDLAGLGDGADIETYINAWPLDEAYIDYVKDSNGNIVTGLFDHSIIKDSTTYANLTDVGKVRGTNFKSATWYSGSDKTKYSDYFSNEGEDENNVETNTSTGYHAIEFMLWGQDRNENGPGDRSYKDYLPPNETDKTDEYGVRRQEYLKTITNALVEDLTWLRDMWDPQLKEKNYLKEFLSDNKDDIEKNFKNTLDGIQQLTVNETGGERVAAFLRSDSQEDEHSCFSDNTHVDMIEDVRGILNVWNGTYKKLDGTTISGPGIKKVIELYDKDAADTLTQQLDEAFMAAKNLVKENDANNKYFDQLTSKNKEGYDRVFKFADDMFKTRKTWLDIYSSLKVAQTGEIETCPVGFKPNGKKGNESACVACTEKEKQDAASDKDNVCYVKSTP